MKTVNKKFLLLILICFALLQSVLFPPVTFAEQTTSYKVENDFFTPYLLHLEKGLKSLEENEFCHHLKDLDRKNEILTLLLEVRKQEEQYSDFYQVVTAQDSQFFAYQVIAKELYKKIEGKEIPDFEFLRYPNIELIDNRKDLFSHFPSLNISKEALEKLYKVFEAKEESPEHQEGKQEVNDILPEVSRQLLSVNFSLETCIPLDSALFVFIKGRGVVEGCIGQSDAEYKSKFVAHIEEIFHSAGIKQEAYKPYLESLVQAAPMTKEGIINQIFLPKEKMKDFLYLSMSAGYLHDAKDEKIHEVIAAFQEERLRDDFPIDRNFQARVIVGSLFNEEVKIFRHTLIPQEEQEAYQSFVETTIDHIIREDQWTF
jgi:hypothetical protein